MKDILLIDGDLTISNGDLMVGDAAQQNQGVLITASAGEFKNNPTTGVGLGDYLLDDASPGELKGKIASELKADGAQVIAITGTNFDNIVVNALYPN